MKRGKRFLENDNLIIYVGTVIFLILAISIGIVMYMANKTNLELEKTAENNVADNKTLDESTENASTSMGKTVEEQENALTEKNLKENTESSSNSNLLNNNTTSEDTTSTELQNSADNTTTSSETSTTQDVPDESDTSQTNTDSSNTDDRANAVETKKEISFIKPIEGEIISEFAKENLIYSETLKEWVTHTGIDIKADKTSVVKSSAPGVIKSIVNDPRYGLTVVITHDDGFETVYSNLLTAEFVVEGEEVEQGQTIGTVGNTAAFESSMDSHLHFELLRNGEYLDPTIYLNN